MKYQHTILLLVLLLFGITREEGCGSFSPRSDYQCHNYSDSENLCCYLTRKVGSNLYVICYSIPYNLYDSIVDAGGLMLGSFFYDKLNCGTDAGMNCSDSIPSSPNDCFNSNASDNNCCYLDIPNRNPRCVYSGNSETADFTMKNGIRVRCGSPTIKS